MQISFAGSRASGRQLETVRMSGMTSRRQPIPVSSALSTDTHQFEGTSFLFSFSFFFFCSFFVFFLFYINTPRGLIWIRIEFITFVRRGLHGESGDCRWRWKKFPIRPLYSRLNEILSTFFPVHTHGVVRGTRDFDLNCRYRLRLSRCSDCVLADVFRCEGVRDYLGYNGSFFLLFTSVRVGWSFKNTYIIHTNE